MSKLLSKGARNEYVWATLILAAALCTAFPDVIFGGKSLLTSPYMAGVMPQGPYGYPHRPLLERIDGFPRYDAGSSAWLTEPNAVLTHNLYTSGQLPLWNPYVGAGQPLAADLFSGVFYPLKFILYIWPRPLTWDLFYLLRLLVAGALGYAYMRQIRVSRLGSLAAGMVFMLNGYFLGFLNMPHLNVEILIPALLLSSEKILGDKKRSGTIFGIVAIACCMLGGNPEAAFFAVMLMSCYYFWRVFRPMKGEHRSAFWLAETRAYLSVVIPGLALSAFLIIPFLEFVSLGSHAHAKTVGYTVNYRPFTIVLSFIPEFFGRTGIVWLRNVPMRATAFGVVPLLVALGGFGSERKKRGFCYFFAVVFVLYLLKAYGAPIINWIGYLPFFNQSFVNKYGFPLAMFGVATAAGIGVENIQLRGQTRWLAALLALLGLFLMISFYYLYFSTLDAREVSNVLAPGTTRQDALQYITIMAIPPAALSISILCLMLVVRRKIIRPTVAASILVALLFLEVKLYLVKLENPTRYDPFTKAPYVELLEKDPERVRIIGLDFILPPAVSGVFGLYDLGNFNAVCVKRYTDFWRRYFTPLNESTIKMLRQEGDKADMLDLCNVKYILSAGYLNGLLESLAYDDEIKIYENPGYFPRAFLADRAIWVPHVREVFEILESGVIDLKRTVVLESSEPHPAESVAVEHPVTPVGDAEITEYRENQVRIRTRTSSGSYLVLLDAFYPGWKAYVDGTPTKVMPAYYLFRAVRVPAGQHEVVFKYSPVSYKIGVLISLLGLFGTIWVTSKTS